MVRVLLGGGLVKGMGMRVYGVGYGYTRRLPVAPRRWVAGRWQGVDRGRGWGGGMG